ncbi:hypothetical protein C8R44DRAFT_873616 [Mycena epipterygia]|nr:hypothetical protein C8R44DRAFT_873616 [Mycena epipterygia]
MTCPDPLRFPAQPSQRVSQHGPARSRINEDPAVLPSLRVSASTSAPVSPALRMPATVSACTPAPASISACTPLALSRAPAWRIVHPGLAHQSCILVLPPHASSCFLPPYLHRCGFPASCVLHPLRLLSSLVLFRACLRMQHASYPSSASVFLSGQVFVAFPHRIRCFHLYYLNPIIKLIPILEFTGYLDLRRICTSSRALNTFLSRFCCTFSSCLRISSS